MKKKETVETKQTRAFLYTQRYLKFCTVIVSRIYRTYDVMMMQDFLESLHFINYLLKSYQNEYFQLTYPNSIRSLRRTYYPRLLDSFQHDCHALLCDIVEFGRKITKVLSWCENVPALNTYIRLSSTILHYFWLVKSRCPAFYDKPPRYVRRL